jgi:hypothetical protein
MPVPEQCEGCGKVVDGECKAYPNPANWWRLGGCPLATHLRKVVEDNTKKRVGQQKQKKKK